MNIQIGLCTVQIDERDYSLILQYHWSVFTTRGLSYVATHLDGVTVYLHRLIMNPDNGFYVDHIDRNPLNNSRSNLRVVSQKENIANAGMYRNNTTGFKGVIVYRNGFRAQTKYRHDGKQHIVVSTTLDTAYQAAMVRDEIMRQLHGDIVFLNLPDVTVSDEAKKEANRIVGNFKLRLSA